MKVIVAGSRSFNDKVLLINTLNKLPFTITEIVSGTAQGADKLGELYAQTYNIPVKQFKPDWEAYGKAAGPIRNNLMAEYADALIAFWDNKSKGTKSMIDLAQKAGLYIKIIPFNA